MANPPPMLPGLGFPVDSEIDLLRKWTWNTWLWAQEDFQPSDIPGLGLWYSAGHSAFDAYTYEQAIPTLFDRSGNGWNATQSTGTAQARFLTHDGRNYFRTTGVSGNCATTAQTNLTGDFTLEWLGWLPDWTPAIETALIGQYEYAINNRSYAMVLSPSGAPQFRISVNGVGTPINTTGSPLPIADGAFGGVRACYVQNTGSGNYSLKFYYTTDGTSWVQNGSTVTGASIADPFSGGTPPIVVNAIGNPAATAGGYVNGRCFRSAIYQGTIDTGLTALRVFDPSRGNFNSATIGSATGETWTINRTGLDPAMIVSARAFLPLTDDYYDIAAGAAGVLRNVGGGTIIWASSAAGESNTGMAISGGTSATENRMASSANPTATTLSVGGRRLDSDSLVTNAVAGQQADYGFAVQAGRLNYASALSAVFKNGSMVGTESAFQTAGNTSNTASLRMRVFANVTEVVDGFASGPTTDLLLYNRALTNEEIFKLSDWMAAQAGIA